MSKQNRLFNLFINIGKFGIPTLVVVLFFLGPKQPSDIFFLLFMSAHCVARVWETFYTTKEKQVDEFQGDWTLAWATALYIVLCICITLEFNYLSRRLNPAITAAGIIIYGVAIFFRWSGVRALGKQWAVHAIGVQKIKKVRLIKLGVYKYIRHPIYLGILFELISLPLICNALIAFLFCCVANIPLQLVRLKLEEKNNIQKLGVQYRDYMKEVSALIPIKYFQKKLIKA